MYYVYIMTNKRNGTLYTGMTSDLARRVWEHKQGLPGSFTDRYLLKTLVYYECIADMRSALEREHRIKKWRRLWKLSLIESKNPDWRDLFSELHGNQP